MPVHVPTDAPRFDNPDLQRAVDHFQEQFRTLAQGVPDPLGFYATVITGRIGGGPIVIPPLSDATGRIIRRAARGATVVTVFDTINAVDRQLSFENRISVTDQIQQLNTGNLSTLKFLVMVAK